MSRRRVVGFLSVSALVVTLLATVGPAAQAVSDSFDFLWPAGVVGLLAAVCGLLGLLLWREHRPPARAEPLRRLRWDEPTRFARPAEGAESASSRKDRETANNAILSASEAYINAHRGGPDFSEAQDVYLPDLREAEATMDFANQNFVDARQRVEQHAVKPVLDATLAIEEAVNQGDYDKAAQIRRDRLVPAVRENMDRPTSGPW